MRVLFSGDPLNPRLPDMSYEDEAAAVKALGIDYSLINFEALVNENDPMGAVRRVNAAEAPDLGIYRGWMLTPSAYGALYDALIRLNITLVNSPESYRHCHYLPESYSIIKDDTPATVWTEVSDDVSFPNIMRDLKPFGSGPIIVKDYVKSAKHNWLEACYIASAADEPMVERVVKRFLELRGSDLNVGLVFRQFAEFEPLAKHSKSGMPLSIEFRLFFLDKKLIQTARYWDEGEYTADLPPVDHFVSIASKIESRFFTMDVAKLKSGGWIIVELGDAQVAELPESIDPNEFFNRLRRELT
jgi:hypothetical protein